MASTAAVLQILVKANTGSATANLKKTDRQLRHAEKSTRMASRSFGKLAKSAVAAGVAYVGIKDAKQAVDTTEDLAKTTLSLHKNLGLSVRSASEFAGVLKARGVETKQVNMAFGTFSKNIRNAEGGSKQAAKAFTELGISQRDLRKLRPEEVINRVADGMKRLGPGTSRTAIGMQLFGRGWQNLLPLLRDGSKHLRDQLALAEKYGVTFKGKTVKSLQDLIQAQREAKMASLGLQVAFGTMVAPALTKAITAVNRFVVNMREGKGIAGAFRDVMAKVVVPVVRFVATTPGLKHLAAAIIAVGIAGKAISFAGAITGVNALIGRLAALKVAEEGVAAVGGIDMVVGAGGAGGIAAIAAPIAAVAAAVVAMGGSFLILRKHIGNVRAAMMALSLLMPGMALLSALWPKITHGVKGLSGALNGLKSGASSAIGWLGSAAKAMTHLSGTSRKVRGTVVGVFGSMWESVRHIFRSGASKSGGAVADLGSGVKRIVHRAANVMTDVFGDAWGTVRRLFRVGASKAGGAFGDLGSGVKRIARGIAKAFQRMAAAVGTILDFIHTKFNKLIKGLHGKSLPGIAVNIGKKAIDVLTPQRGGKINVGKSTGDSVPALLERGEYVLNRKAASKIGTAQLDAMNFAAAPRFQEGGQIPPVTVSGRGPMAGAVRAMAGRARGAANRRLDKAGVGGAGAYHGKLDHNFGRGSGQTISFNQAAFLAEKAGLPGVTYAQIARGESGLRPGAVSPDGGFGLWQMTPRVQSSQTVAAWHRIGSYFNPWKNALMAKYLAGSGTGVSNYFGTGFVTDWNKHYSGKGFQRGGAVGMPAQPWLDPVLSKRRRWQIQNGILPGFQRGGGVMGRMVSRANAIDRRHFPYVLGGGHGGFRGPYDCSGAVSAVLHSGGLLSAPRVSGGFMNWGAGGPGAATVYANPGHVFMSLNGKYFGTSHSNPGGGAGWIPPRGHQGFAVRHVPHSVLAKSQRSDSVGTAKGRKLPPALPVRGLGAKLRNIKKMGLSKAMTQRLAILGQAADRFGEYASRAQTLTTEGDDTTKGQHGLVFGFDETHWLQKQLDNLFWLRHYLIRALRQIERTRKRIKKTLLPRARKHLQKLRKHPLLNRDRIKAYKQHIIPALQKRYKDLGGTRTDLLSKINDVQGAGGSMKLFKVKDKAHSWMSLPPIGELGGSIFDVQSQLQTLGQKTGGTPAADTTADTSERLQSINDLLKESLQQSNLRTAVSERAFATLRDLPFAGSFGGGGIVPGPVGRPMAAVVHGGEAIGQPGNVLVTVLVQDGAVDSNKIRVIARDESGKTLRSEVRRTNRTPGGAR